MIQTHARYRIISPDEHRKFCPDIGKYYQVYVKILNIKSNTSIKKGGFIFIKILLLDVDIYVLNSEIEHYFDDVINELIDSSSNIEYDIFSV